MRTTPSSQLAPVTKKSRHAGTAPVNAKMPSNRAGLGERCAIGPIAMRTTKEMIVATVVVNDDTDPAATGMPRKWTFLVQSASSAMPGQAADLAMAVMKGPKRTVWVVVTKAELAQSYQYQDFWYLAFSAYARGLASSATVMGRAWHSGQRTRALTALAARVCRASAGELPVPRFGQRAARLGPGRVVPAVERSVLLHPLVGGGAEGVDPTAQVEGDAQTVRAGARRGGPHAAAGLDRILLAQRAV